MAHGSTCPTIAVGDQVPSIKTARKIALDLPGATEEPYHGASSFRVKGKVFATVPDRQHLHIMVSEDEICDAVASSDACEEKWWGKKLAAVLVSLPDVDENLLGQLLLSAWSQRAPRKLLDEFDA